MFLLQVGTKVPEVMDGSCLSQQPIRDTVRSQGGDPTRIKPPTPVSQPAATLAGVHSEHTHLYLYLCVKFSLSLTCVFLCMFVSCVQVRGWRV